MTKEEISRKEYEQITNLKSRINTNIDQLEKDIARIKPTGRIEMYDIVAQKQIAISNLYVALSQLK